MMTVENIPKSPQSVRSWKSFGSRKGSKIFVEEDLANDQNQQGGVQLSKVPSKLKFPNFDFHESTPPPSDKSNQDAQFPGTNRGKLLQPPKTPPKLSECAFSSEQKINLDNLERIPFDKEYAVELIIKEAVGLPPTVAATRIHAKLHMPTRNDVRSVSEFAYGELLSDHTAPKFIFSTRYQGTFIVILFV